MKITINDLKALSSVESSQMISEESIYLDKQGIGEILGGFCEISIFPMPIYPEPPYLRPPICPRPPIYPIGICPPIYPPPVICPAPPVSPIL
jgi:hypothetical protein